MTEQELRGTVLDMCRTALEAKLSLDELRKRWPLEADSDEASHPYRFFNRVLRDIEDGVEHTPGYFLKKEVNFEAWRKSDLYWTLTLDAELLGMDQPVESLERCYEAVTANPGMPNVKEAVQHWFESQQTRK